MFQNFLKLSYQDEIHNYEVSPRVIQVGKKTLITIKPLSRSLVFDPEKTYEFKVRPTEEGDPYVHPERPNQTVLLVQPKSPFLCEFFVEFPTEQEYSIRIHDGEPRIATITLYAVKADLVGRYPFRGDLHMHTCRSDGKQTPAVVAANFRKSGYDFMAITDHNRYWGALEALEDFKDAPIEFCLVPGEEVHPRNGDGKYINDVHIVNFGGDYSINALMGASREDSGRCCIGEHQGQKPRAIVDDPPPVHTYEEHWALIDAYEKSLDFPECVPKSERYAHACCRWTFEEIRKANGLGIYCHPFWVSNVHQIPSSFHDYMVETQPFDAYEVLGGERNYQQNGFQAAYYYEDRMKGRNYPIVGSTDCHCSLNFELRICCTIVFSPKNERHALIQSIKDFYSVAVDTLDETPRYVGDLRLIRYSNFLERCYFPLHDELVFEEGRAMKDFANGDPHAREILEKTYGRVKRFQKKIFAW